MERKFAYTVQCDVNDIRLMNFASSKNLIVKNTKFSHCNIHRYTSPDSVTHNQMDHVLVAKRRQLIITDFQSF